MPKFWFLAEPHKSYFQSPFSILTCSFWEQSSLWYISKATSMLYNLHNQYLKINYCQKSRILLQTGICFFTFSILKSIHPDINLMPDIIIHLEQNSFCFTSSNRRIKVLQKVIAWRFQPKKIIWKSQFWNDNDMK